MAAAKKRLAWIPPRAEGNVGRVDGIRIGVGKENGAELSESQIKRLRDTGLPVETEKAEKDD